MQTSAENSADGGYGDEIVPAEISYEASGPSPKSFEGWHHPRKQFVRKYQWCALLKILIQGIPEPDRNQVRYLGLPGVDLLDLRYIHSEICRDLRVELKFLGFNSGVAPESSAATELNISMDEVFRLEYVNARSEIIHDNFTMISNTSSLAWRKVNQFGPFDVVNLDLCGGFCSDPPNGLNGGYYQAVHQLLSLQARRSQPWLFLLTTRTDGDNVDLEVFAKLVKKYSDNLTDHEDFRRSSEEIFAITQEFLDAGDYPDKARLAVLLVGISKWLIANALGQNPRTIVKLESVMGYRVIRDSELEDMISLAFLFKPTTLGCIDPIGLSSAEPESQDECALAVRALKKVGVRKDLDALFLDPTKEDMRNTLISETEVLLSSARYDIEQYRSWLATS